MKQIIVQINGKQGAGKTSLANALETELTKIPSVGVAVMGYADPVYQMMHAVLTRMQEYGAPVELISETYHGVNTPKKNGDLLQTIATWARRTYGEDVWVNIMKARIAKSQVLFGAMGFKAFVYIIHDLRFPNEAEMAPSLLYRLNCNEGIRKARILATPGQSWRENTTHESEVALDCYGRFYREFNSEILSTKFICGSILVDLSMKVLENPEKI